MHGGDGNDTLGEFESTVGSATGGYLSGFVFGDAGNDTITNAGQANGGAGDDTINNSVNAYGGDGNDTIAGGTNFGTFADGGAGDDHISGVNDAFGGTGNDVVFGYNIADGGDGDDIVSGYGLLHGGNGNDRLTGYGGGSTFQVDAGDTGVKIIDGGSGSISATHQDVVEFGAGISVADVSFGWGTAIYQNEFGQLRRTLDASVLGGMQTVRVVLPDDFSGVEAFRFADGTMLTMAEVTAPLGPLPESVIVPGTDGDDFLIGDGRSSRYTFIGGKGNAR